MKSCELDKLAREATSEAFERALATGNSVLIAREGKLIKVHPDRTEEFIKNIEPPVKIPVGTKYRIK